MSLIFGGATTDVVSVAAATSLNNLATKTVLVWVYVTTITTNRGFWGKATGNHFSLSGTTGNIRIAIDRATTDSSYITNTTPVAVNTWTCAAYTYDNGATPSIHIYTGTPSSLLVEATYGTATDGSGSVGNDSASAMLWGNRQSLSDALQGRLAVGMMWNRVLTLGELRAQQFNPHMTAGCVDFKLFGFNETSTQPDWSGNLNAGTVTGATVGPHAPLPPAFGFSGGWLGTFTAATGVNGTLAVTLADVTLSSAATLALAGTLSSTLDAVTLSSAGALALSGSLSQTLQDVSLSSNSALAITATLSQTLADVTLSSAATLAITGSVNVTLADVTLSSQATLALVGSLSATLDAVTLSSNATVAIVGTLTQTLGDVTLASDGNSTDGNTGSVNATLDAATLSSIATLALSATVVVTLDSLTLSSTGVAAIVGTLSQTLGDLTLSADADLLIAGTVAQTLDAVTLSSAGSLSGVSATLAVTLDDVTLSSLAGSSVTGTFTQTLANVTLISNATLAISGQVNITLAGLTGNIIGMAVVITVITAATIKSANPAGDIRISEPVGTISLRR